MFGNGIARLTEQESWQTKSSTVWAGQTLFDPSKIVFNRSVEKFVEKNAL